MSLLTSEQRCAYFQSTLWCAELLGDPEWEPIETDKRALKVSSADTFFSETLATERTIRTSVAIAKKRSDQAAVVDQIKAIYAIGDGVNGYVKLNLHAHLTDLSSIVTMVFAMVVS